jgi:DNA-binding transcriptional ArsR family regulator
LTSRRNRQIVNLMVKSPERTLTAVFGALADPTRRHVLMSLSESPRPVTELARPHAMSLPGFMKHLCVLEDAGLIARTKEGRVVRCTLSASPMQEAAMWLSQYEQFWSEKLDSLADYLAEQEESHEWKPSSSRKSPRSPSPAAIRSRPRKSGARGRTRKR